jgi:hypothetical protein
MTTVRETIKRDIGIKVEGVVKVFDPSTLTTEIREYVVTDKIEAQLKTIFDTFTQISDTLRRGGTPRDVMGMWVSGFFGSGKSHFAKVLGYLLQNDVLDEASGEHCIDVFMKHLSDTPRGKDLRLRLAEVKQTTQIKTIAFEIKSRQSLTNPNSVGEILLGEFYRSLGLSDNYVVARIERRLQEKGLLDKLSEVYENRYKIAWSSQQGRGDLSTVRRRLGEVLPDVDPDSYPDQRAAKESLADQFRHQIVTAEGIADELVAWVNEQNPSGGKVQHLIFVIDEMGTFIGDSNEKIGELNALSEMIGNKGKGKVWLIVTSQQDLEKVVDRTNFQPALVGRLNARFELKPQLISDEINRVVSERILKKKPAKEAELRSLYEAKEGGIAQLADIKASRRLGDITPQAFTECYPFLPHQIRLSQDIFEKLSGFRLSGGVRSMISVSMETLQKVADEQIGVIASLDQVFDAVANDLISQEYLGASGIQAIQDSDQRVQGTPLAPARVLKVLWLLQRITWVPRIPETLSKLLVRNLSEDFIPLRKDVEETLAKLQEAGYVARDEATGEWKFLSERERTIEQSIQEMVRTGGPKSISVATVRRTSQLLCKGDLITKTRLPNFAVPYGKTKTPFSYGVALDGEAIGSGPEIEVNFYSPLAPGRKQTIDEIRSENQAAGVKGRRIWWVANPTDALETRFKRHEALVQVTGDKRFTEDSSKETQDALSEKRKERDELRNALVQDMERAFLSGSLFYGGQEIELESPSDLKGPIGDAIGSVIPNVYSRFGPADRTYDFSKDIRDLLNPANTALHQVASKLDLFDTQGTLQRDSTLVLIVLEVIRDLEDEDLDPMGSALLDSRDSKGFKGFDRAPFGWPSELVRLVLAACFRAGAIYMERSSPIGATPIYDYKGTADEFLKITSFKKATFRIAETSLSVEQVKAASKALIAMGVNGIPESGNAIAGAVRDLGTTLQTGLRDAKSRAEAGLPVAEAILSAEGSLTKPLTSKDPTKVAIEFLASEAQWKTLHDGLAELDTFVAAKRPEEFKVSRQLVELVENHPVTEVSPQQQKLAQALLDMAALVNDRAVVNRWSDYRTAMEQARDAYREVYSTAYEGVSSAAAKTLDAIQLGAAYLQAPLTQRDSVVSAVFGPGKACNYPPLTVPTTQTLLNACALRTLSSLEQAVLALPAYQRQVETALRELVEPPAPKEKTWQWQASNSLAGKRFNRPEEVDEALSAVAEELKKKITEEGMVVVVT